VLSTFAQDVEQRMQLLTKPWSWKGIEPCKRSFGEDVRKIFAAKGYKFTAIRGGAATPGSSKLHIPDYELPPLEYEDDDDSCAAAVLPSLGA
jgi:hypothetical protein